VTNLKKLKFLGTGSSTGVPVVTCDCDVCKSLNPFDKRLRPSVLLTCKKETLLIDTSSDFRVQALTNDIKRIDKIFYTHSHNDHVAGLDDIRVYNYKQGTSIPLYSTKAMLEEIKERFSYIFRKTQEGGGKPQVELVEISNFDEIKTENFTITPVPVYHGELLINGFIIDNKTAYLTDVSFIPKETFEKLYSLDTIIIGALRSRKHQTHFSFDEAIEVIKKLNPKRAFFTHISDEYTHNELVKRFSPRVTIPYDGLEIEI
jgi:phosphoribosyl 1,2-cyclic phosphate phosphodiesterase